MPGNDRLQTARDVYGAYVSGDRTIVEAALSEDFTFYSPPDPGIDRAGLLRLEPDLISAPLQTAKSPRGGGRPGRPAQSGYSSFRHARGSSGCAFGVRSSRKL